MADESALANQFQVLEELGSEDPDPIAFYPCCLRLTCVSFSFQVVVSAQFTRQSTRTPVKSSLSNMSVLFLASTIHNHES